MTSPWRWLPKARRYQNTKTGKFLSNDGMKQLRDAFMTSLYDDANKVTARLARKEITLNEWLTEARQLSAAANLDSYIMARGGRKRMTPKDWGWCGAHQRSEYKYLQAFASEIADGTISEAQAARRLRMYVDAGKQAYMMGEREAAKVAGLKFERNLLHAAESCDGCRAETNRGLVPVGRLKPIGTRDCKTACLCTIEYVEAT